MILCGRKGLVALVVFFRIFIIFLLSVFLVLTLFLLFCCIMVTSSMALCLSGNLTVK